MAEIGQARPANDPGMSVQEWADTWGKPPAQVYMHLRRMQRLGLLDIGRRWAVTISGKGYWLPVYRLRKEA